MKYILKTYVELTKQAFRGKYSDSLSVFYILKMKMSHGRFPTLEYASRKTGFSKSKLERHIRKLKSVGLIEKRNGEYFLCSYSALQEKYGRYKTIKLNGTESQQQVRDVLFFSFLKHEERKQKFILNLKRDVLLCKKISKKQYKWIVKNFKSLDNFEVVAKDSKEFNSVMFTNEWIANELGISKTNVFNTVIRCSWNGLIKKEIKKRIIARCNYTEYLSIKKHGSYTHLLYKGGVAYLNLGTAMGLQEV